MGNKALLCTLIVFLFLLTGCTSSSNNTYPHSAEIVAIDYSLNIVTVRTSTGLYYYFTGTEDYAVGDIVSMIMDSQGTEDYVIDDIIVKVQYSGYTKPEAI